MKTYGEYVSCLKENLSEKEVIEILREIKKDLPEYWFVCTDEDWENFRKHMAIEKAIEEFDRLKHEKYCKNVDRKRRERRERSYRKN